MDMSVPRHLRRRLMANNVRSTLEVLMDTGLLFRSDLRNTVVPSRGTGSATFTRATTATVTDHEDVVRSVLSGEVRFQGARRVRNYVVAPENLNGSQWTKQAGAVVTQISGAEWEVDISACANGQGVYFQSLSVGTFTMRGSVSLRAISTSGDNTLTIAEPFGALFASFNTPALTSNWVRIATPVFSIASVGGMWFQKQPGQATVFRIKEPQLENVTGQSIQTPAEYVSVGVLSSPFHGAMVDGVKYFSTTNGNTVASNVVTEASGLPISSATLKGYLAEGARTNLCLQSNAFTTTWTQFSGTCSFSQNVTGPDGVSNSAWTLTDPGAAIVGATQSIALTNATTYAVSVYIKKTTGALTNYPAVTAYNASYSVGAVVDTTNGTAVAITSYQGATIGTTGGITVRSHGDYWRVSFNFTANATASWSFTLHPAYNATGTGVENTVTAGSNVFYGAQLEAGSFASSYIPTTTVSVTRNADVLTYPFSENASATVGSAYAELSTQWTTSGASAAVAFSAAEACLWCPGTVASTTIRILDGVNSGVKTGLTDMSTASRKRASSWGGSTVSVTGDGASVGSNTFDGGMGSTSIGIGNLTDGSTNWFGTIRNVRIYQTQLSSEQLQAVTA